MGERINERDSFTESEEMMDYLSDQLEAGYIFHMYQDSNERVIVEKWRNGEMKSQRAFDIWDAIRLQMIEATQ